MRVTLGAALLWAAMPAAAQDWAVRAGDGYLSDAEMRAEVVGHRLTFFDNGVSDYGTDGDYSYTYDGGGTAYGVYTLGENGVVCAKFQNGFDRCDMIVRNRDRLIVITEKGDRYPVRDIAPN